MTVGPGGNSLDIPTMAALARRAGVRDDQIPTAVSIALAESSGNPSVFSRPNTNGTIDRGLWQINSAHRQYSDAAMKDPFANAQAMAVLSGGGANWHPWTTFNTGAYRQYLPKVQQALGSGAAPSPLMASGGSPMTQYTPPPDPSQNPFMKLLLQRLANPGADDWQKFMQTLPPRPTITNPLQTPLAPNVAGAFGGGTPDAGAALLSALQRGVGPSPLTQEAAGAQAQAAGAGAAQSAFNSAAPPLNPSDIQARPLQAPGPYPMPQEPNIPQRPPAQVNPLAAALGALAGLHPNAYTPGIEAAPLEAGLTLQERQYQDLQRQYQQAHQQAIEQYDSGIAGRQEALQLMLENEQRRTGQNQILEGLQSQRGQIQAGLAGPLAQAQTAASVYGTLGGQQHEAQMAQAGADYLKQTLGIDLDVAHMSVEMYDKLLQIGSQVLWHEGMVGDRASQVMLNAMNAFGATPGGQAQIEQRQGMGAAGQARANLYGVQGALAPAKLEDMMGYHQGLLNLGAGRLGVAQQNANTNAARVGPGAKYQPGSLEDPKLKGEVANYTKAVQGYQSALSGAAQRFQQGVSSYTILDASEPARQHYLSTDPGVLHAVALLRQRELELHTKAAQVLDAAGYNPDGTAKAPVPTTPGHNPPLPGAKSAPAAGGKRLQFDPATGTVR